MAVTLKLEKGQKIELEKVAPGLENIHIGLSWDPRKTDGQAFDLDASVLCLDASGKLKSNDDIVYYNNRSAYDNAIVHHGDNLTGEGDGDDEVINIKLSKIPSKVERLLFVVTIYQADQRKQNFEQVPSAAIRLVNKDTNQEIARFDLNENYSLETAMEMGEIYRYNGEWKFNAIGQGYSTGLDGLVAQHS